MRIGWIGLGNLGRILIKNLIDSGFNVKVWNRTISKAKESGLPFYENLEDLLKNSDVVITMLFGSDSSMEVYQKIIKSNIDIKGKLFIDMTTVYPDISKKIAEMLIKKGGDFLEAPVIGSIFPAKEKKLTILVSGDKDIFERNKNIFMSFGENIIYMGDYGKASIMKLINNFVLGAFMTTLAEAVTFGKKAGISPETVVKILEKGAGKSMVLETKKEKILKEDYSTHFSIALLHKDISYACDLSKKYNFPAFMTTQVLNILSSAMAHNLDEKDFSAIIEIYKKISNV